jgi:hypothetical protein
MLIKVHVDYNSQKPAVSGIVVFLLCLFNL